MTQPLPAQLASAFARNKDVMLVLGGARSGKSRHAEALMRTYAPPWIYIATAEALDDEMADRIEAHRRRRDQRWMTLEAPLALTQTLQSAPARTPVLIDCLTLWLSNLLLADQAVEPAAQALEDSLVRRAAPTVVVSNEVGWGVVPTSPLGRRFRDAQGWLNQRVATVAGRVDLVAAGLPIRLK